VIRGGENNALFWNRDRRVEIMERRASGQTFAQIATHFGVSKERVRRICRDTESTRNYGTKL
jgi:uncharacterized protein (DUF433 family)